MVSDKKLSARLEAFTSPRGYWIGLTAIKKLAFAAKVTEQQAKDWRKKQALWQIYLPAPRHIPRPKGHGSRRVKIGPVTKINEIWLYCICLR